MTRRFISSDEAVPAKGQHTRPCSDCPLARSSIRGWLGGSSPEQWVAALHSDEPVQCHVLDGAQCAGAAIYRANVCKLPRWTEVLRLPPDTQTVFATPAEFTEHHDKKYHVK